MARGERALEQPNAKVSITVLITQKRERAKNHDDHDVTEGLSRKGGQRHMYPFRDRTRSSHSGMSLCNLLQPAVQRGR
jgi:hypothetical protein